MLLYNSKFLIRNYMFSFNGLKFLGRFLKISHIESIFTKLEQMMHNRQIIVVFDFTDFYH